MVKKEIKTSTGAYSNVFIVNSNFKVNFKYSVFYTLKKALLKRNFNDL